VKEKKGRETRSFAGRIPQFQVPQEQGYPDLLRVPLFSFLAPLDPRNENRGFVPNPREVARDRIRGAFAGICRALVDR
jgi:hypothetical protein